MNNRNKIVIGVIVVAIVALGYIIYNNKTTRSDNDLIKIGAIVGSTGQYGVVGENYIKGINLAKKVWIEQNPNNKIEVIIEDDAFDPKKGLAAYQKFVGINKVDALINMTSPTIDAIYSSVQQSGIPVAQGGEQGIEPADDNVFQLLSGNIETEVALGKFVKEKDHKNIAVFYANNATFVRFFNAFKKGYEGTVTEFPVNIDDRDYRTHVTKALTLKPDAMVFITTPEQGASLVKVLREQSNDRQPYFFDASLQTGFADYKRILGDMSILNGSSSVVLRQNLNADFVSRYKDEYGEEPGIAADWAYDSFNLLMRNRADNWKDWVKNMKNASFDGAGGQVKFDSVGVRIPDFFIGTVENGTLPQ